MDEKYLYVIRMFTGVYFFSVLLGWLWFGPSEYTPEIYFYLTLPALFISTTIPTKLYSSFIKYPVGALYVTSALTTAYVIYNNITIGCSPDTGAAIVHTVETIIYIILAIIALFNIQIKKSLTKSSSWTDNP